MVTGRLGDRLRDDRRSTLAVIPTAGGRPVEITSGGGEGNPDWSPDGRSIAYSAPASDAPFDFDIWVMDVDGKHRRPVVDVSIADFAPRWSPDGSTIAFSAMVSGDPQVYVVGADGEGVQGLSSDPDASEQPFAWSPDGAQLLFLSDRSGTGGTFLYAMDADDGANVALLVRL